jgi:hypothetical protein
MQIKLENSFQIKRGKSKANINSLCFRTQIQPNLTLDKTLSKNLVDK